MEDRPVQEGYHRPERKKKRAGLPAFFLAVIVLALLAAVVLRIWLGYRSGSLAAGDITVLRRGLPFGVGAAGLAAVLAVAGLLRKKRRRGFAAWGLALALVALVLTGGLLYADHYLTGKMTTDDDFDSLSASDLHQTATEADGRLEREERFSEALSGLEEQLADLPSFTEVDRYLLSNNDIPAEALAKLDTGKAPRSSYLSSDASKIQVFVLFGLDGVDSSDSVMLVALDRVHQKIKLISLARDSYVFIPEYGFFSKLAYSYTWGGAAMAVKNLNYNYYLNVSDYIAVDFEQLAVIIDRIGGVTVNIDEDEARYLSGYPNVRVGDCLLDGETAVSYARIRKSSATDSDRKRTGRQREVILSILNTLQTMPLSQYPGFVRDCLGMCATSFEAETLLTMAAETLGQNYTVEQYFFPEGQVDWWAGLIKEYFYYVYDLRRASDRIYRIIYEELYISGYDDLSAKHEAKPAAAHVKIRIFAQSLQQRHGRTGHAAAGFFCYPFCCSLAASSALASWSGQDVGFEPQRMPCRREISSSTSMPSASRATPCVLPLQPPIKRTFETLLPSSSNRIWREQTPCGV